MPKCRGARYNWFNKFRKTLTKHGRWMPPEEWKRHKAERREARALEAQTPKPEKPKRARTKKAGALDELLFWFGTVSGSDKAPF